MPAINRPKLPTDSNRNAIQQAPASPALARSVNASLGTAVTLTFNAATTWLRCYAITKDVYLKWGSTAVTSSNFDEVLPVGQIIDLVIPTTAAGALYTTATIIESAASGTCTVIEK